MRNLLREGQSWSGCEFGVAASGERMVLASFFTERRAVRARKE